MAAQKKILKSCSPCKKDKYDEDRNIRWEF